MISKISIHVSKGPKYQKLNTFFLGFNQLIQKCRIQNQFTGRFQMPSTIIFKTNNSVTKLFLDQSNF